MIFPSFTLSLREDVAILQQGSAISLQSSSRQLTFRDIKPGLNEAFHALKQGRKTFVELQEETIAAGGFESAWFFETCLQKLTELGWIYHLVLPLAKAIPMVGNYQFDRYEIDWKNATFSLSRFAYLHCINGEMYLESPLSKSKIILLDWRSSALIAKLSQPQTIIQLIDDISNLTETLAQQFIALLLATQMLSLGIEHSPLIFWEFHDLLFHSRSRMGRHDLPSGGRYPFKDEIAPLPAVKPLMGNQTISLYRPNIETLQQTDMPLTQALEQRRSVREYDEENPITVKQLGEILYRCTRVKEVFETELGQLSRRPYPSAGALYELEFYPLVRQCSELDSGFYQYHPLEHILYPITEWTSETEALIAEAWINSGQKVKPQILLIITARFGRFFWKYRSMGYAAILKEVGVIYQTLYLVATSMNLAPAASGSGNSDIFAAVTGIDYYEETSVGEFMLGSMPR